MTIQEYILTLRALSIKSVFNEGRYNNLQAYLELASCAVLEPTEVMVHGNCKKTLQIGEVVVSLRQIMKKWKWGSTTITKFIKLLEVNKLIECVKSKTCTIIKILPVVDTLIGMLHQTQGNQVLPIDGNNSTPSPMNTTIPCVTISDENKGIADTPKVVKTEELVQQAVQQGISDKPNTDAGCAVIYPDKLDVMGVTTDKSIKENETKKEKESFPQTPFIEKEINKEKENTDVATNTCVHTCVRENNNDWENNAGKFSMQILETRQWGEVVCMRFHIKDIDALRDKIAEFDESCFMRGQEHYSLQDYKQHFISFMAKQQQIKNEQEQKQKDRQQLYQGILNQRQQNYANSNIRCTQSNIDSTRRGRFETAATCAEDYEGSF